MIHLKLLDKIPLIGPLEETVRFIGYIIYLPFKK